VEEHYPQPFFVSLLSRESVSRALVRVALKPPKHSEVPAKITASWDLYLTRFLDPHWAGDFPRPSRDASYR
jgi:hypothetical protein